MYRFFPKSSIGKLSIFFMILMPILFIMGTSFADLLYRSVSSGDTILQDITNRPILAITMLTANTFGVLSFIFSLISILKKNERSISIYITLILTFLFVIFLFLEILSTH